MLASDQEDPGLGQDPDHEVLLLPHLITERHPWVPGGVDLAADPLRRGRSRSFPLP
jgi:hypothetical protein